jgi:sugar phosphate isomerase/epimerase
MYFTGFADEAAKGIDGQIAATRELGWEYIEARSINGVNIHDVSEAEFDIVFDKLAEASVKVNCFGSTIANWAEQITDPFEVSIEKTKRAIIRMQRLGTKLIRIMSYAVLEDRPPDDQMEQERFRRLRELKKMFNDAGIKPVHENCMNYGGLSPRHTLRLIENVPGLRLVFDTGNPVYTDDRSKPKPYPKQSSWEFYEIVKDHISHIHIKDAVWNPKKKEEVL